jgi:hypothetical protein
VALTPSMPAGSSVANSGIPCRDSSFPVQRVEHVPAGAFDVLAYHGGDPWRGGGGFGQQVGHAAVAGQPGAGQRGQVHQERRQARLARVSDQLRELYGPLNALVDVNERIWEALRQSHLPPQADRRPEASTEDWRRWRDHALMPANRRMRDLIIEHADLLVETTFHNRYATSALT